MRKCQRFVNKIRCNDNGNHSVIWCLNDDICYMMWLCEEHWNELVRHDEMRFKFNKENK